MQTTKADVKDSIEVLKSVVKEAYERKKAIRLGSRSQT